MGVWIESFIYYLNLSADVILFNDVLEVFPIFTML